MNGSLERPTQAFAQKSEYRPEQVAGMVELFHRYLPEDVLIQADQAVDAFLRMRDVVTEQAPAAGRYAQELWDSKVVPVLGRKGELYTLPAGVVLDLGIRLNAHAFKQINETDTDSSAHFEIGLDRNDMNRAKSTIEGSMLFSKQEKDMLLGFLAHDMHHVMPRFTNIFMGNFLRSCPRESDGETLQIHRAHFERMQAIFSGFPQMVRFARYPFDFMAAMVKMKKNAAITAAGRSIKENHNAEIVSLFSGSSDSAEMAVDDLVISVIDRIDEMEFDIVEDVINPVITILHHRFAKCDLTVKNGSGEHLPLESGVIGVTVNGSTRLRANFGMVASCFYNMAKNGLKAVDERYYYDLKRRFPENLGDNSPFAQYPFAARYRGDDPQTVFPYGINFAVDTDDKGYCLSVEDSGIGLSTDALMRDVARKLEKFDHSELEEARFIIGDDTVEALLAWKSGNPHAARSVEIGRIWDSVILPRLSGFGIQGTDMIGSGFGLWGVNYITRLLKGKLEISNRFEKGAAVKITIPSPNI